MESTTDDQPDWLGKLRLVARVISIVFIIIFSAFVILMGLMMNRPAPASDYIALASCSTYVIGLLIGFKLERLGGLISLGFVITSIIYFIYWDSGSHNDGTFNIEIYIGTIVLTFPCILYLLSWYFHKKLVINHPKTEEPSNEN
jgi:hypothetical protein